MSAILQVGNQQIAADQFVSLLSSSQLLPQLLREFFIEQAIASVEYTPEELERYCQELAQKPENYGLPPQKIQEIAPRKLKLQKFKTQTWGNQVENTFLHCKEQLDRVLFSLIQSEDVEIIQELYFRLQEGEESFAQLSTQYSQGPEAHSNGLVGPIELNNLHPKLAQVLRVSQPGQLSPPIRIDKWLAIVRLERYIPAQFDEKCQARLLDELFEAWLQEQIAQHAGAVNFTESRDEVVPSVSEAPLEGELEAPEPVSSLPPQPETPPLALPARSQSSPFKKVAGWIAIALIPFGLGMFTLEGMNRYQARQNPVNLDSITAATSDATVTNSAPTSTFQAAVNSAMSAANLTQDAKSNQDWQEVVEHWQSAIASLEDVSPESDNYSTAQDKIPEYEGYLEYAEMMANRAVDPFHEAVNNAMRAAELTQDAESTSDWETVAEYWQSAVESMQAVPEDHPRANEAPDKAIEYQNNLDYAQAMTASI
ncbi:MAG: peptidylprolyl isomerase [Jaaginema sp. PMC 1079.18]|nr:peptidylprolyl isomerase [Jaaginema sp. PMC 1080.18]MEC4850536.1 peptidylprolyl isomerase [Jaaginema sp. PMC 1079.18]MEC4865792.1 peptidylprolyl isomerase [Jaaginema sp. PMC 1078.18]